MKVRTILNNYQLGSYAHRCMRMYITDEKRIDSKHTEITWELNSMSDRDLLQKALGKSKIETVEQ